MFFKVRNNCCTNKIGAFNIRMMTILFLSLQRPYLFKAFQVTEIFINNFSFLNTRAIKLCVCCVHTHITEIPHSVQTTVESNATKYSNFNYLRIN